MLLKDYLEALNKLVKKDNDYIVNLVHDLDFEGLLYLRNVVEDLIKK